MVASILRRNSVELFHLLLDLLPRSVVRTELYRKLRRWTSKTPQRFEPPLRRETSPDPLEWPGRKLVSGETDLVIEGFPGSGNSYLSNSVRAALDRPLFVESHFHYTAQLKRALALGVPAVVVVREPLAAWHSLKSKEPELSGFLIALRWILYHRYVLRHLQDLDVVLFDTVKRDVDSLRRHSKKVGRLLGRPMTPDPSLERRSPRRRYVTGWSFAMRRLRRVADRLYQRIRLGSL